MKTPIRIELVSLIATDTGLAQALPAVPKMEPWLPEPASTAEAAEKLAEFAAAPLPVPIPAPRPERSNPDSSNPGSGNPDSSNIDPVKEHPLAKFLPPPRPARMNGLKAETKALTAAPDDNSPADSNPVDSDLIEAAPKHTGISAPADLEKPGPDAPTNFASLTAPMPKSRPARPKVPRGLPSISALPAITGIGPRSIRAAATEQGLPLDRATLIGILNLNTGRKALLRLPNGRYRSVIVGDVLDGWRVSMIGLDAMRITRSGEDRTLLLINR